MAGLCRANEEREGGGDCSVYSHVPCRLSSGESAMHTQTEPISTSSAAAAPGIGKEGNQPRT